MTQNMITPSETYPSTPTSTMSPMPNMIPDPSMLGDSFDQLIFNRGVKFIHKRAIPCPNINTIEDNVHDPLCPHCDGSGIFYYQSKEIVGYFSGNQTERQFEYNGIWEAGTAVITFATRYADGVEADFSIYDKLVCTGFTVRLFEQKMYEPRPDKKQQLRYPIQRVAFMATASSTEVIEYVEGEDFTIDGGKILWIDGHQPDYDADSNIGETFSISYYSFPEFVVLQPLHELRITQQMMPNGIKTAKRLPQSVVVKRDFYVNSSERLPGK